MEATNISINKQSSVSINVETLNAIKQRMLSAVAACTARNSSLFTLHFSLNRLYRKELRLARAVARAIDAHPTLSNLWIGGWSVVCIYLIFMYA